MQAHRYYFEQYRLPIPEKIGGHDAQPDHLCRVRLCVNPDHLEIVARPINVQRGKLAKITAEEAGSVKALYEGGLTRFQIGERLGINPKTVGGILRGSTWKGIAVPI